MTEVMDRERARVAGELGEDAAALSVRKVDWDRMLSDGVSVALHIRRWRANKRLTLEDLGLVIEDEEERAWWDEFLSLGEKKLLPARYLKALASADALARWSLKRWGFQTAYGTFVPAGAYASFKAENAKYRERYMALAREISDDYLSLIGQVLRSYAAGARGAYRRLERSGLSTPLSEDEFVANFLAAIQAVLPGREEVARSFAFETELTFVPLPSLLEADLAERERIRFARDREYAEGKITDAALAERRRQLDAMTADVVAQAKVRKERELNGFIDSVVGQLRTTVYDVALDALEGIKKADGTVVERNAKRLEGLVATVAKLNFYGDAEITAKLAQVQALLQGRSAGPVADAQIQNALAELGTLCRVTLLDLGHSPRSGRAVGIADVPAGEVVRQARRAAGINPEFDVLDAVRGTPAPAISSRKGRRAI